jgi:hypothetical protein
MADEHVRRDLLLKTALEILRDTGNHNSLSHKAELIKRLGSWATRR